MGIIVRRSILVSIISYIGVVIGYINLLYLYPKYLEIEQVGLLRTIQDTAMLFTPFALFGLGQSIIKYYPHFSADDRKRNQFITLIFTLGVFSFGIFLIVFFAFRNQLFSFFDDNADEILNYIDLILWLTFLLLFISLLEQYPRSLLNIALPAFLREIAVRLLQAVLVLIYFMGHISFPQLVLISVLIYLGILVILAGFVISKSSYKPALNFREIPNVKIREIFTFSTLSFVGTSAMILIAKMDSVMVTGMVGLASNAVYTTAFYMATVIEIPKRALTTTASPLISAAFEKGDMQSVEKLYVKTSLTQFIIGALLLIGIWANLDNIFDLMPKGEKYREGAWVVVIIGVAKLIDMLFGPSSEIIGLSKHYWFNLVVISILAGVVIVANYLLIPSYGINGAAYGSLIALFVYNATKFLFIWFRFNIQPFSLATVKILMIVGFVGAVNLLLPDLDYPLADTLYRSLIITVLFTGTVLSLRISDDINRIAAIVYAWLRGKI